MIQLARKNIQSLKPYSSARHEFEGKADIFLDANENPFNNGMNRYPDPFQEKVKERIEEIKGISPKNTFLGNGSDEAIDLLLRIYCEPGKDHIITLPPTYGMYQVSADINNVEVKKVNLTSDFQPDVPAILQAANSHSKILFICSPNNPTGNSIKRTTIKKLIQEFKGIVVIDEAYIDFATDESATSFIGKYPNIVVLQTFSKAWAMAGIRLGMAFASEEIIGLFNKVKPPYNINSITQKAALVGTRDLEAFNKSISTILEERQKLAEALSEFSFVQKVYPSDANFILVKVEQPNELYDFLVRKKIVVRNRSTVVLCEGCLRFTIGKPKENDQLLKALRKWEKKKPVLN